MFVLGLKAPGIPRVEDFWIHYNVQIQEESAVSSYVLIYFFTYILLCKNELYYIMKYILICVPKMIPIQLELENELYI